MITALAYTFHIQPSELAEFTADDLQWWWDRHAEIDEAMNNATQ